MNPVHDRPFSTTFRRSLILTLIAGAALLAACGKKEGGSTQVAAKVNKEEISVHQVNFVLQRQPGIKPEQANAAGKRILEGLIDQQLAVQQAEEQKLDRDPRVVMAIEAAKREIIARAYADKLAEGAAKPTPDEIRQYYDSKPTLFAQRRIFTLQEVSVEADAARVNDLSAKAQTAHSAEELATVLRSAGVRFAARQVTQAPENMPMGLVERIGALSAGKSLVTTTPTGFNALFVTTTKAAPVSEEQAKPAIEAFLLNDRKRQLVESGMKTLRQDARIEYVGQFAGGPGAAARPATPPTPAAPAASGLDDKSLQKGLSGLK